jgi:hypothetical protein
LMRKTRVKRDNTQKTHKKHISLKVKYTKASNIRQIFDIMVNKMQSNVDLRCYVIAKVLPFFLSSHSLSRSKSYLTF